MKTSVVLLATFASVVVCGTARCQQTQAVSRLVTVYTGSAAATKAVSRIATVFSGVSGSTQAVSRIATLYTGLPGGTQAVSRAVSEYTSSDQTYSRALSRNVTAWLGFSVQHAATALRIAAGLHTATPREKQIFDVITAGTSGGVVDVLDACKIAIYAMNPSWLP